MSFGDYLFSKRVASIAVRHAYRYLKRRDFIGEAERLRLLTDPESIIPMIESKGKQKIVEFGIKKAIRELSVQIRLSHLTAEYRCRTK